jgi:hypothetical protein
MGTGGVHLKDDGQARLGIDKTNDNGKIGWNEVAQLP